MRWICKSLLRLWGWKITGSYPYDEPKFVMAVAPHTSNWDFIVGLLVRCSMRLRPNYVGKDSLFRPPHGFFFRWLGGIPVDRSQSHNFVSATAEAFKREPKMQLVIAPEGTRKKVDRFRTGFYYIAREAGVPIVLCKFDWENKTVFFDPEFFHTTEDAEKDLDYLWNYFKGIKGAVPEKSIG